MKKISEGLSVVLPAYNEEANIDNVLHTLVQVLNNSDIDFEVIVVDNGSTDNTVDIVKEHQVNLINCRIKGAAACRNFGVEHSKFDKICFLDSDCLVNEYWAINIKKAFFDTKVGAYGGPCLSPKDGTWVEKAWAPIKISFHSYSSSSLLAGCNFAVKTEVFTQLGGFKEALLTAEDDDLSRRIINSGQDCVKDSKQHVIHLGYPRTLKETFFKVLWHGTTQLRAHGFFADKMVLLTLGWLLSVLASVTFISHEVVYFLFMPLVLLFLPALLVAKKLSHRKFTTYEVIVNYILVIVTLSARAIGLIIELFNIIKSKLLYRAKGS